mmetsp:Transcript_3380/g.7565  ORF Transcript_3380/g.7565 Transcript_3380/m.7565 type:complete len:298 (+) Transcript_3380:310-1203(+)
MPAGRPSAASLDSWQHTDASSASAPLLRCASACTVSGLDAQDPNLGGGNSNTKSNNVASGSIKSSSWMPSKLPSASSHPSMKSLDSSPICAAATSGLASSILSPSSAFTEEPKLWEQPHTVSSGVVPASSSSITSNSSEGNSVRILSRLDLHSSLSQRLIETAPVCGTPIVRTRRASSTYEGNNGFGIKRPPLILVMTILLVLIFVELQIVLYARQRVPTSTLRGRHEVTPFHGGCTFIWSTMECSPGCCLHKFDRNGHAVVACDVCTKADFNTIIETPVESNAAAANQDFSSPNLK